MQLSLRSTASRWSGARCVFAVVVVGGGGALGPGEIEGECRAAAASVAARVEGLVLNYLLLEVGFEL